MRPQGNCVVQSVGQPDEVESKGVDRCTRFRPSTTRVALEERVEDGRMVVHTCKPAFAEFDFCALVTSAPALPPVLPPVFPMRRARTC